MKTTAALIMCGLASSNFYAQVSGSKAPATKAPVKSESPEHKLARFVVAEETLDVERTNQKVITLSIEAWELRWIYDNCYRGIWYLATPGRKLKAGLTTFEQCKAICGECVTGKDELDSLLTKADQELSDARNARSQYETDLQLAKLRLSSVDKCLSVYRSTYDKKYSDITPRDTEQMAGCKQLDQYPPKK
jgi:hypothetical protein